MFWELVAVGPEMHELVKVWYGSDVFLNDLNGIYRKEFLQNQLFSSACNLNRKVRWVNRKLIELIVEEGWKVYQECMESTYQ